MKKRTRSAPSLRTFEESGVQIACSPELLRNIWKSKDRKELETYVELPSGNHKLVELRRMLVAKHSGLGGPELLGTLAVSMHRERKFAPPDVWICKAQTDTTPTLVFVGVNMQIGTERVTRGRIYGAGSYARQRKGRRQTQRAFDYSGGTVSKHAAVGDGDCRDSRVVQGTPTGDSLNRADVAHRAPVDKDRP